MKDSDWVILHELYKNPNMTKVANLLYTTQPSLTKRIQNMEAELQVTIVNREPQGLVFTPEGKYLAERAKEHIAFMEETRKKLKEIHETMQGRIAVGAVYAYSKYNLPEVLFSYKQKHPGIEFEVVVGQSNDLFPKLLDGTIDVAFIRGNCDGPVNKVFINKETAYFVTKEPVELKQIPYMNRIDYIINERTKNLLDEWWRKKYGAEPPSGTQVGYMDFAWPLIAKNLGYICCFLSPKFPNEHQLCLTPMVDEEGKILERETWFVYTKNKRIPKVLEEFISYIVNEVAIE